MNKSAADKRVRIIRRLSLGRAFLLLVVLLLLMPGCDDENLVAFRDAAASGLQTGANAIMDGIVDGLFAALLGDAQAAGGGAANAAGG